MVPLISGFRPDGHASRRPRVLVIVQNLSVPFDRRVWLECRALTGAGYDVTVICPNGPNEGSFEVIDGVTIHRYALPVGGDGLFGFVAEYAYSLSMTAWLLVKAWRHGRFDVIQACNPPDIFWLLAVGCRTTRGTKFVFDHHDLCPELYVSRFPGKSRVPYWCLRALEWCTHRTADHVIVTNGSYREVAIGRGGKRESDVTVVRTGPDPDALRRRAPDASLKRGRRYLVAYIGVMGPQDGVDIVLRVADRIVHDFGRDDVSFTLIGSATAWKIS